jgi:carbamoyltransferase
VEKGKSRDTVQISGTFVPATAGLWLREVQVALQSIAGTSFLRLGLPSTGPRRYDHHRCHAVAACVFADVDDNACLVIDGEREVGAVPSYALRDRWLKRLWQPWGPRGLGTFHARLIQM